MPENSSQNDMHNFVVDHKSAEQSKTDLHAGVRNVMETEPDQQTNELEEEENARASKNASAMQMLTTPGSSKSKKQTPYTQVPIKPKSRTQSHTYTIKTGSPKSRQ